MAALIGPARTKYVLMGGQKIAAARAEAFGLVDELVEPDALMERALALCTDTVAADPKIAHGIKRMCGAA